MSKVETVPDEQVWYIYINEETRGPMALRDLDVQLRTNEINSRTFCWKTGMKEWKPMVQIEELKQSILDSSNQVLDLDKKNNKEKANSAGQKNQEDKKVPPQQEDHMIQNQDENPLTILEVTVDNLLKKSFHQSEDGKWSIYDQEKAQWVLQDQEPIEKIAQMKALLMNKLKNEFFADDKNKRKIKQQQPEKPLTKQQIQKRERNKKKTKRAAEKKKEKWYQARINTFVYISGLPFDITEEQLKQFATKAGVLRVDLASNKQKIKIYKDQNQLPKGDAAVSYARQQSVQIALQMLNDSQIRPGFKVKVEKAEFNQKDQQYKKRQNKKTTKVKKIVAKNNQNKLLAWDDDIQQKGQGFKIIIMKYVFTLEQSQNEQQMAEIKSDITAGLNKIGEIKRIRFFENHPDGIVQIKFDKEADAQKCIHEMNNRYFDGRQLVCEYWDGETDYKKDANSLAFENERLTNFGEELIQKKDQKKEGNIYNGLIQKNQKINNEQSGEQKKKGVDYTQ